MSEKWNQQMAIVAACEFMLAELVRKIHDGPEPYADIRYGDVGYDERLWAPAMRFWAGLGKALIEYLQDKHRPVTTEEEETMQWVENTFGAPYEPCGVCGRWYAPEDMLLRTTTVSGPVAKMCLRCEKIYHDAAAG